MRARGGINRTAASGVGVCLSGSLRTFLLPCVGRRLVNTIILPLGADLFASINVPNASQRNSLTPKIHRVLDGTKLIALDVHVYRRKRRTTCSNDNELGYPQTVGLQWCADQMLTRHYAWIVRVRTDAWVPFVVRSLPEVAPYGPAGAAITTYTFVCQTCRDSPRCDDTTLCYCTNDHFAMLAGARAQHAYLRGFGRDSCQRTWPLPGMEAPYAALGRPNWVNRIGDAVGLGHLASRHPFGGQPITLRDVRSPECKLGWSLASRGVPLRDLTFASCHSAAVRAVRTSSLQGGVSCTAAQLAPPSFELRPEAVAAVPTGPSSHSRRQVACGIRATRPAGWEALCSSGGGGDYSRRRASRGSSEQHGGDQDGRNDGSCDFDNLLSVSGTWR